LPLRESTIKNQSNESDEDNESENNNSDEDDESENNNSENFEDYSCPPFESYQDLNVNPTIHKTEIKSPKSKYFGLEAQSRN
jgi:hypothetical protein